MRSSSRSVRDALGFRVGSSHSEVFVDRDGPVLVETGARLCGTMVPRYPDEIANTSIVDLAVAAYLAPAQFTALASQPRAYRQHPCAFVLRTGQSGVVRGKPGTPASARCRRFAICPGSSSWAIRSCRPAT